MKTGIRTSQSPDSPGPDRVLTVQDFLDAKVLASKKLSLNAFVSYFPHLSFKTELRKSSF